MKSLIWDLDGTLIHSAPDIQAAANKMLADMNLAPLDLATIESFIGNGIPKLVERCLAVYNLPLNDAAIEAMRVYYDADCTTLTAPYAGVLNCLKTMQARGVKMAICTNKPLAPALTILNGMGLSQYFDVVVGGDTYAHHKPHPAPLLGCVEQLGVAMEDCIYIGDSETDAATAANGNMTFALFSGGYRKTPVAELPHDFLFDHFDALTQYLTKA
ncbi:MAG: phosphoglycolate phosphatase [Rhodobacteraceae bacterium]|nr:phosphoglycolate phosphatase [Paracoccaceae bacterium]